MMRNAGTISLALVRRPACGGRVQFPLVGEGLL